MLLFGLSVRLVIFCHGIICSSRADRDCCRPLSVHLLRLALPYLHSDIPRRYHTAGVCSVAVSSRCRRAATSAAATTGAAASAVTAAVSILAADCRTLLLTSRSAVADYPNCMCCFAHCGCRCRCNCFAAAVAATGAYCTCTTTALLAWRRRLAAALAVAALPDTTCCY